MLFFYVLGKNYKTGGKGKMRNVEKIAERALKGVEKIARAEVKRTAISSVSACSAIWHQPKRPKKR